MFREISGDVIPSEARDLVRLRAHLVGGVKVLSKST
jgi:hypothetical protein